MCAETKWLFWNFVLVFCPGQRKVKANAKYQHNGIAELFHLYLISTKYEDRWGESNELRETFKISTKTGMCLYKMSETIYTGYSPKEYVNSIFFRNLCKTSMVNNNSFLNMKQKWVNQVSLKGEKQVSNAYSSCV